MSDKKKIFRAFVLVEYEADVEAEDEFSVTPKKVAKAMAEQYDIGEVELFENSYFVERVYFASAD